jgi:hypothetical protein
MERPNDAKPITKGECEKYDREGNGEGFHAMTPFADTYYMASTKLLTRSKALVLGAAFSASLVCAGVARADPMGSVTGQVTTVTGSYINITSNHQILHFILPMPFTAVYYADKSRADLTNVTLGAMVRISFTTDRNGMYQAREIDILSN